MRVWPGSLYPTGTTLAGDGFSHSHQGNNNTYC